MDEEVLHRLLRDSRIMVSWRPDIGCMDATP
jgi:hypothetical protein